MDWINLKLAGLSVWFDLGELNTNIKLPPGKHDFLQHVDSIQAGDSFKYDQSIMVLRLRNTAIYKPQPLQEPVFRSATWEVWKDINGNLVFSMPSQQAPVMAVISPDFSHGDVILDPRVIQEDGFYPLENLDIRIIAAWLASKSDLLLHASGVKAGDDGYCFIGPSGSGKSTLASNLAENHSLTVLGEDQIILRFINDRFWIYGTPWHTDQSMCSPLGVPLKKVFFLDRKINPGVTRMRPSEGVAGILKDAFIPYYFHEYLPGILDRLSALAEQTPFYLLSYLLGSDPWPSILNVEG